MPIKIKRSQKRLIALTLTERAKPIFFRLLNKFIKEEVINAIESGRSPVAGSKARFKPYSKSYVDQITGKKTFFRKNGKIIPADSGHWNRDNPQKKQRPVNLTLTGTMLRSIKSRKYKEYVRVWFSDKKAKYHNNPKSDSKIPARRMFPFVSKGEKFNAGIRKRIVNALEKAIKLSKK